MEEYVLWSESDGGVVDRGFYSRDEAEKAIVDDYDGDDDLIVVTAYKAYIEWLDCEEGEEY